MFNQTEKPRFRFIRTKNVLFENIVVAECRGRQNFVKIVRIARRRFYQLDTITFDWGNLFTHRKQKKKNKKENKNFVLELIECVSTRVWILLIFFLESCTHTLQTLSEIQSYQERTKSKTHK